MEDSSPLYIILGGGTWEGGGVRGHPPPPKKIVHFHHFRLILWSFFSFLFALIELFKICTCFCFLTIYCMWMIHSFDIQHWFYWFTYSITMNFHCLCLKKKNCFIFKSLLFTLIYINKTTEKNTMDFCWTLKFLTNIFSSLSTTFS